MVLEDLVNSKRKDSVASDPTTLVDTECRRVPRLPAVLRGAKAEAEEAEVTKTGRIVLISFMVVVVRRKAGNIIPSLQRSSVLRVEP